VGDEDTAACHHDDDRSEGLSYDQGAGGGFVPDSFGAKGQVGYGSEDPYIHAQDEPNKTHGAHRVNDSDMTANGHALQYRWHHPSPRLFPS